MESSWSSTLKKTLKSSLVPEKNDVTGNPCDTPSKEEDSTQGTAVKKGHSAYEIMIQSLEEQARNKGNKHTKDCYPAQGTQLDAMGGTSGDHQRRWMQFVCGNDSAPACPVPSSPPAVVKSQEHASLSGCVTYCLLHVTGS